MLMIASAVRCFFFLGSSGVSVEQIVNLEASHEREMKAQRDEVAKLEASHQAQRAEVAKLKAKVEQQEQVLKNVDKSLTVWRDMDAP